MDSFGDTADVLLAQKARLQQLGEEKAALASENGLLGAAIESLQVQLRAAQKRAAEAEAKAEARAASDSRQLAAAHAAERKLEEGAGRARRRAANDRILLEQAERGRRDAEAALAAARQQVAALQADNRELRQRLTATEHQVRQLEELQPFADGWQEQRRSESALAAELDGANTRVQQLEGRCAQLERELQDTAAALTAARQLAEERTAEPGGQRAGSLSLSDLCDLDGAPSQFVGGATSSPQRSVHRGGAGAEGLPSRRRALQQRQAAQEPKRERGQQCQQCQHQLQEEEEEERQQQEAAGAAAAAAEQPSLVEGLRVQLLEQQRQLAHIQLQQQVAMGSTAAGGCSSGAGLGGRGAVEALAAAEQGRQLAQLRGELDKLRRRNSQLQAALADSSMQQARVAAALQKQQEAAQQEAALLRGQRDDAQRQLAALQAAALSAEEGEGGAEGSLGAGGGGSGGGSAEQLEQLLEYASRCNAAVEQNAALLQEKKGWLEKLRAAEGEAERLRSEVQQLCLQHLQLLAPAGTGSNGAAMQQQQQQVLPPQRQREEELVQRLLEAQAGEAALRSVLQEARQEQVAACKALSCELRRVHALERLRISDMAEVQRLQRRLHDPQRECRELCKALATAQQQLAAGAGRQAR